MSEVERSEKVIWTKLVMWQMRKLRLEREVTGASELVSGRTRLELFRQCSGQCAAWPKRASQDCPVGVQSQTYR